MVREPCVIRWMGVPNFWVGELFCYVVSLIYYFDLCILVACAHIQYHDASPLISIHSLSKLSRGSDAFGHIDFLRIHIHRNISK